MSLRSVVIADIRATRLTVAAGARVLGCQRKYLERLVWAEVKDDVLARDGACIVCGRSNVQLDVHHRIARGSGGSSRPEIAFGMANLVTLCRADHDDAEAHPGAARATGLRVDRGSNPASVPVVYRGSRVVLDDLGGMREAA